MLSFFVAACGSSSDDGGSNDNQDDATPAKPQGPDGPSVDHEQRAQPGGGHPEPRQAVRGADRASRSTSSSSAGTSSRTASATPRSPARARTSRRPAPRRSRSSPRSAGSRTCRTRSARSAAQSAYAPGIWKTSTIQGQDGTFGHPVVHRGPHDLLPQGRAEGRGRRPEDGVHVGGRAGGDAREAQGVTKLGGKSIAPFGGPGKKAYDLVHNMMPWVWDAGGAELNDDSDQVHHQLAAGGPGRQVRHRPRRQGPVGQVDARA